MSILNFKELKRMPVQAGIMIALVLVLAFSSLFGYRILDIFGTKEWEREGPPGANVHGHVNGHYSGSHHYFHK